MGTRFRGIAGTPTWVLLAAAVGTSVGLPPSTAAAQTGEYVAPRLPGTSHPNLSGIWQAFTTANWDLQDHGAEAGPFPRLLGVWGAQPPGQGVVVGNEIPLSDRGPGQKAAEPRAGAWRSTTTTSTRSATPRRSATCRGFRGPPTCRFRSRSSRAPTR